MKNVKDIVIGIFAVIGFFAIASGFSNNQAQAVNHTVPESHVWEAVVTAGRGEAPDRLYLFNKQTGVVRKYNRNYPSYKYKNCRDEGKEYVEMKDVNEIELKD